MIVTQANDPAIIRETCISITTTIPEWFGQPAANERYAREIGDCDCFLAEQDGEEIGLIALRYHFDVTAEIWWLGVKRDYHRSGAGRALVEASNERAIGKGCRNIVLETLSPEHPDPGYAMTRAFYSALGFRPLVTAARGSGGHPMMWMIRPV